MNTETLKELQAVRQEFDQIRKKAWEKFKAETLATLDKQEFPDDPKLRDFYINTIERLWIRGYADGCHDSAIIFAREMGFGGIIEVMENLRKVVVTDPTKN